MKCVQARENMGKLSISRVNSACHAYFTVSHEPTWALSKHLLHRLFDAYQKCDVYAAELTVAFENTEFNYVVDA